MLFNAVCGADARDRSSLAANAHPVTLDAPPSLRILHVPVFGEHPLDARIEASVARAAAVLAGLGHRVETGTLPFDLQRIDDFWPLLGQVGLARVFMHHPAAEALAAEKFRQMADAGRKVSAARYLDGIEIVRAFRREVAEALAAFDLILTPSAAALPWPAGQPFPTAIAGRNVGPRGHAVYTGWVNACGHPAINLPCDPADDGLPIGFQLVGRYGDDERLFRVAAQYERAVPFGTRWPALAGE
jgi:aspartyl-tRNA(Asn)/glutamyl-tRNA(Gln) amidotransferase subunit A